MRIPAVVLCLFGHRDTEETSLAGFTFQFDMSPLPFNGPSRDGQAETGTATITRPPAIDAVKSFKDSLMVLKGNSRTLVHYLYQTCFILRFNAQADRRPLVAVANCVLDQVQ